jgi:transcription antitermination factor NusG
LNLPLFPSYCFARINWRERVQVATIPGVVAIVSAGREPSPVPDHYITWLQAGVQARRIRPHSGLAVGDRVSIVTGPFAGMQGVLERQKNEFRVILKLEMIGRSMSVEVGAEEIATLGPRLENRPPAETYSQHGYSPC